MNDHEQQNLEVYMIGGQIVFRNEYDDVPSRSNSAIVAITEFEDDVSSGFYVIQYCHHEGVSCVAGTDEEVVLKFKESFACTDLDNKQRIGVDRMFKEIEAFFNKQNGRVYG